MNCCWTCPWKSCAGRTAKGFATSAAQIWITITVLVAATCLTPGCRQSRIYFNSLRRCKPCRFAQRTSLLNPEGINAEQTGRWVPWIWWSAANAGLWCCPIGYAKLVAVITRERSLRLKIKIWKSIKIKKVGMQGLLGLPLRSPCLLYRKLRPIKQKPSGGWLPICFATFLLFKFEE